MTLWLTRVQLDRREAPVRRDLQDATRLHQRVMSLVPHRLGTSARHAAAVLFRLDSTPAGPVLLIQSAVEPSFHRLPDRYGTCEAKEITPLLDALREGLLIHYRLAANPSKRVAREDGRHRVGQVIPLSGATADAWWQRQADNHGLQLRSLHPRPQPAASGRRLNGGVVRHAITCFDGQATVRDPDRVREAIVGGIGRGKSFGCGLLSVAPVARKR